MYCMFRIAAHLLGLVGCSNRFVLCLQPTSLQTATDAGKSTLKNRIAPATRLNTAPLLMAKNGKTRI